MIWGQKFSIWGLPEIVAPFGVLIIRIIVFGTKLGSPYFLETAICTVGLRSCGIRL